MTGVSGEVAGWTATLPVVEAKASFTPQGTGGLPAIEGEAGGRKAKAEDSMTALMAKAVPSWRWQAVQWQQ